MTLAAFLLVIMQGLHLPGPASMGTACMPYSWSDDPATSLFAPAGMVRMEDPGYQLYGSIDRAGDSPSIHAAAAGMTLGGFSLGAGGGWSAAGGADTLSIGVASARTVRGDPIGFMEGIFGPSISVGCGLDYTLVEQEDGTSAGTLCGTAGMQFSIFPTIALGMNVSGVRIAGDPLHRRRIGYGVTSIFDKSFRGHISVTEGRFAMGAELLVGDALTVRSGSDGRGWNSGLGCEIGDFILEWSILLSGDGATHYAAVTIIPGASS